MKSPDEVVDYKGNKIHTNKNFCSVLYSDFLTDKHVKAIKDSLLPDLWLSGETTTGGVDKTIRNVRQQVCTMNEKGWPLEQILEFGRQANNDRYKFELQGFLTYDVPQIMEYGVGGHYDWHIDVGNKVPNRKLSFTIQLSDSSEYEGGDIEFLNTTVKKEHLRKKGVAIIFPSFLPHRITPVTKGVRHAIVGWIHGETFK